MSDARPLSGRTAVITGGASGIGLALAQTFGEAGCKVLIADIEQSSLEAATDQLRINGIEALGCVADVTDPAAMERLAAHAISQFGTVNLLFNNAGVSITGPTWSFSQDDWRWVWAVNVLGVVNGIRAFLPHMIGHHRGGRVVNTGSLASFAGTGDHAAYCASKAAVLSLSQSLYSEMRAAMTGIGVSVICPGMVATNIHRSWRNRPTGDVAWSQREIADAEHRADSDAAQARGIAAEDVARATLLAVLDDRFYILAGANWQVFLEETVGRTAAGINPRVITWGEDRRPLADREPAPWLPGAHFG